MRGFGRSRLFVLQIKWLPEESRHAVLFNFLIRQIYSRQVL